MLDSITSCLAVIASLCITGSATAEVRRGAGWSGAILSLHNATATSMIGSDTEILPYPGVMREFCSNGMCILYRGHCGEATTEYACTLWYSYDQAMPLRKIDVTGDRASVSLAMDELRLVRAPEVVVSLSRFRYDAHDALPPTCYSREGCPPR
jgi:hypothetical protein